jgi:hypothetical protein
MMFLVDVEFQDHSGAWPAVSAAPDRCPANARGRVAQSLPDFCEGEAGEFLVERMMPASLIRPATRFIARKTARASTRCSMRRACLSSIMSCFLMLDRTIIPKRRVSSPYGGILRENCLV